MPSLNKERAKTKAAAKKKSAKVSAANLDKLLDIKNTPDAPRKTWHRTHGKKTGLGHRKRRELRCVEDTRV